MKKYFRVGQFFRLGRIRGNKKYFIFSLEKLFQVSEVLRYKVVLLLLCWYFTALRNFSCHFGRGLLTYPQCSQASLIGSFLFVFEDDFTHFEPRWGVKTGYPQEKTPQHPQAELGMSHM